MTIFILQKRISLLSFLVCSMVLYPQEPIPLYDTRLISTAMPFLNFQNDARAAALAGNGVATAPDVFSNSHNPSKYLFSENKSGLGLSYTPYLNTLTDDMFLGNITYFNKNNRRGVWSAGFHYFKMGKVDFTELSGDSFAGLGTASPNELTLDVAYSLLLSDRFGMGVGLRWLHSNLKSTSDSESLNASSIAVDVSLYYRSDWLHGRQADSRWMAGMRVANIGPKLVYEKGGNEYFIPAKWYGGLGYELTPDYVNTVSISIEFSKLLVPTPPIYGYNDVNDNGMKDPDEPVGIISGKSPEVTFLQGIWSSFSDAPGGFSEEWNEIAWGLGLEYAYNEVFFLRAGCFYEDTSKGNRSHVSLGAGFTIKNARLDFAYAIGTTGIPTPLDNSLRVSLTAVFF